MKGAFSIKSKKTPYQVGGWVGVERVVRRWKLMPRNHMRSRRRR
jgi:hypothetical protein